MERAKDIYEHLAEMRALIGNAAWPELEDAYRRVCVQLAGPHQAGRIASLDFKSYERSLGAALKPTLQLPAAAKARALYFEYDLDNDWDGAFFLCQAYAPESVGDDDWACEWLGCSPGPSFTDASSIYLENHFDRTPTAKGSSIYLVARTVAAFGRCCNAMLIQPPAVCVAFHDQNPVFRLRKSLDETTP